MTINAHRAFENSTNDCYRKNLTPSEQEIEELRDARDKVRATLKSAFSSWEERATAGILFEDVAVAAFGVHEKPALSPKFRGQGSYSYKTLNQPTHNPPQEMDFDDGMFLPTSFISQGGKTHPVVASRGYFALVEEALEVLCEREGWSLLDEEDAKDSCVRVLLNNGRSHLDVALYAIPDEEYQVLLEKASTSSANQFIVDDIASLRLLDEVYETIDPNQIMLAHRKEGWKISDPRLLERWFISAVQEHGEQLRRVARYLKGWRDQNWKGCRLSSIALMACAVRFFQESRTDYTGRDDLALLEITRELPAYLVARLDNPVVDGRLDEGWDDGSAPCRHEFVKEAELLRDRLALALSSSDGGSAIERLRQIFGIHFPKDESLVQIAPRPATPAIVSSGILGSLGAASGANAAVKIGGSDRYG